MHQNTCWPIFMKVRAYKFTFDVMLAINAIVHVIVRHCGHGDHHHTGLLLHRHRGTVAGSLNHHRTLLRTLQANNQQTEAELASISRGREDFASSGFRPRQQSHCECPSDEIVTRCCIPIADFNNVQRATRQCAECGRPVN